MSGRAGSADRAAACGTLLAGGGRRRQGRGRPGPARPGRWDAVRAGWLAVAGRGREAVGCGGALSRGLPAFELGGGGGFEEEVQGVVVFVELTPVRCVTSVG